ncbi:MAG TPA: RHS repeat-associated core domain-containing protein, partial [Acidobacteriaceae bacterium]|nr:RHS repeat-associated core domain-containing protein [Acidobacteriaceae bacterium]
QPVTIYATWNNSSNNFYFMETPYWGAGNNNGNLQSSAEYVGNNIVWGQWTYQYNESFTYDKVNRLSTAIDSNTACGGTCWSQYYQYDTYGNMWVSSSSGVPAPAYEPGSYVYNPANNRRTDLTYDGAGNTTSALGDTAAYDAENRLISMTEPPSLGSSVETYAYDGNGQRVLKVAPGAVDTLYVYDVFGHLAAEYTTAGVVAVCQTCFLTYDHLNSVRMVTDRASPPNVISRHDYLPFGQEVIGYADRFGFGGTDNVTQRFTGQERDSETGLDYFGARYYANNWGRFASPDEPFADQNTIDPRSWSLYSYVRNNPLRYVDLSGEDCITTSNQTSGSVTVTTQVGGSADTCNGTYVDGTVDTSSYQYNGSTLSWSDTSTGGGGAINFVNASIGDWDPGSSNMLGAAQIGQTAPIGDFLGQLLLAFFTMGEEAEPADVGLGRPEPPPGMSAQRPGGIPDNWVPQPSKKGGGTTYVDPANPYNRVRQMPGNPSSPNPAQQRPYVKWMKDGQYRDVNGNAVPGNSEAAHIPADQFRYR